MTIHAQTRIAEREKAARRAEAKEAERAAWDKHCRDEFARRTAAKAQQAADAKAADERAYAIRYAAMSPFERDMEDHVREVRARTAAELAAERLAAPTTTTDRPKPRPETMTVPIYDPPALGPDATVEALEARSKALEQKHLEEPSEGNKYQALVATAEAAKALAFSRFEAEAKRADEAVRKAVAEAGDDPVSRAKAKARAVELTALRVGQAEADAEAAALAYDSCVIETAKASKLAAHRITSRQAAVKADEARAANDPMSLGNPFYRPPVSLAKWQYDALSPEDKIQASKAGVRVYDDPAPSFTQDEAKSVLRSRNSTRPVLTRAEFAALAPQEQSRAARNSIIVDA